MRLFIWCLTLTVGGGVVGYLAPRNHEAAVLAACFFGGTLSTQALVPVWDMIRRGRRHNP